MAPARGGPLDLVDDGRTGLLFDPDRPDDLADRVRALVEDPGARRRMGAAGRASVEDRTWAAVTDELVGHYERAVTRRRGVPARVA